jgi:hypothetical protein
MSQNSTPIGVAIVHQYYPGFIDVPTNSQFLICSPDVTGSVHVLAHVRPLVVTDFNNELYRKQSRGGRRPIEIRRPISRIKRDTVSADARGFEGRTGPVIAIEKDTQGRVFYQDVYTSLQLCTEFDDREQAENLALQMHGRLLERFIGTYRYLNPDTRLVVTDNVPEVTTPLRVGYYFYSTTEQRLPLEERIINAWPDELRVSIVALDRGARALRGHVGDMAEVRARGERLAGHLGNGFALSENLLAVERLADLAFSGQRPRSAVVEAMSIAEVGILEAQQRFMNELQRAGKIRKPNETTWKFLIEAVLPALLDLFDGDKGLMMKRAKEVLCIRHSVVHESYGPSMDEANKVLSFVRALLTVLELPDQFKGNWKRRGG